MRKQILKQSLGTINWIGDEIVDWYRGGECYSLKGKIRQLGKYHFAFDFDSSITSSDGQYAFIYKKLATKGLLLKDGEILREINRSYYHANVYEYPVAFLTHNKRTYLAHCPISYCQLDFEDVETGEIITNAQGRKPSDIFHSRLEISKNNQFLLSKGWVWHPVDIVQIYNIADCFINPNNLDNLDFDFPCPVAEISTASFISEKEILIGSSAEIIDTDNTENLPPKSFAVKDFINNTFSKIITPKFEFGNLIAIDGNLAWDIYEFPKIINVNTGEIVEKDETVFSGKQRSSIIFNIDEQPQIAFNKNRNKLAIKGDGEVIIMTNELSH